jgi:hypothetical protein
MALFANTGDAIFYLLQRWRRRFGRSRVQARRICRSDTLGINAKGNGLHRLCIMWQFPEKP